MSSHFAASTIAKICSLRITYERLKSDEYGKHTREGIWRRISKVLIIVSWPEQSGLTRHCALQLW
jgi:hypothetical protein